MKIQFLEFRTQKLSGDRSIKKEDCSNFNILIDDFLVREFNQYDSCQCHILNFTRVFREASRFAESLADKLDLDRPICETMVYREVTEMKWIKG